MRDQTTALTPEWQGLDGDSRLILAFSRGKPVKILLAGQGRWWVALSLESVSGPPGWRFVLELWRSGRPGVLISTALPAQRKLLDGLLAHGCVLLAEAVGEWVIGLQQVKLSHDELREVALLRRELAAKELDPPFVNDPRAVLVRRPE